MFVCLFVFSVCLQIIRNTTPAYRTPEMIDLYSNFPINEKQDIWVRFLPLFLSNDANDHENNSVQTSHVRDLTFAPSGLTIHDVWKTGKTFFLLRSGNIQYVLQTI